MGQKSIPSIAFTRLLLLAFGLLFVRSSAYAVIPGKITNNASTSTIHAFPEPEYVKQQVAFWNAVFLKFPASTALIHDSFYPTIIVDLIDHEIFAKKLGNSGASSRRKREQLTKQYIKRYELGLQRFAKFQSAAARMGAIEQRLYNVYKKNPNALKDLYQGRVSIRYQTGLADEFQIAAKRAASYLPHMERLFAERGLPVDLTRLAFVESMFNVNALSKVGASGIWQFMPETAKRFMRVDSFIDERNNPFKATRGASRLLKENYANLGSWPLAITAYNHGTASLQRAIKNLGTKDFETIATSYNARSFGFASRNFYAEFLSARDVYNTIFKQFRSQHETLNVVSIRLPKPTTLEYLMRKTPLTREVLQAHNRCLLPSAYRRYLREPLPKGFELVVPSTYARSVQLAIDDRSGPFDQVRM